MDSTYVKREARGGHLGCPDVAAAKERLESQGSLGAECRFIATHFSHNGEWLHERIEEYFRPVGIEVGYDGMVVEL
jgi:phosphoribosyl 1,2-cyclic phosphate phosphodiesterase